MVSTPDFAGSMKGKRNIDSLKDSIFTEISRKKIDASKIAIDVRTKLDFFNSIEDQYKPLFSDLQYIIYKPLDDFKLAIQSRIDAYTTVDRVIITQEKTEQILVVRNEEQSREMEIKWRDAQKEIPENFQVCVVIGETKTTDTISPYIALYSEHNDTFQNMATHKIFVPRKKARWWFPLETPNHPHPMDV